VKQEGTQKKPLRQGLFRSQQKGKIKLLGPDTQSVGGGGSAHSSDDEDDDDKGSEEVRRAK
jgi:hypothetical protein